MKRSYLIQRLKEPFPNKGGMFGQNPFAFGGGYKNGGLSNDAMGMLNQIFRFDYMGSAEFEFGALPDALRKIAGNITKYGRHEVDVKTKAGNEATVYIICQNNDFDEISATISKLAYDEYARDTTRTKERVFLMGAIDNERYADYTGWLELDNGYFFFVDKDMFDKTANLFGIQ